MALYKDLFNFAAKVGCLEGYLFDRAHGNFSTLPNWVGNIERMHKELPEEMKKEFFGEYKDLLEKILVSAEQILDKDDLLLTRLRRMTAIET